MKTICMQNLTWASAVITYATVARAIVRRGPGSYKCFYVQQAPREWPMWYYQPNPFRRKSCWGLQEHLWRALKH